ncbi:hypothetical protein [Streptosporangium sp. NPDC001681]|uniref:hypothetical protein n=1 Tax=Streptosporangium sp. NPDC001681 TaxID=3154395 RepID=UPI0033344565
MASISEDFEDTSYAFTIAGTWARSSVTPRAGSWCFKSATIGHSATTDAAITVPTGATTLRFWYRVSSESGYDFFRVLVGGVQVLETSGTVAWTQSAEISVAAATQVVFRYVKDTSQTAGEDAAYIDDVVFTTPEPITNRNTFNGGTNGATITTGNSGGSSGNAFSAIVGAPQFSAAQFVGPSGLSALNPTSGADTHLDWNNVGQPGNVFCARLYMYLVANVAGPQRVFVLIGESAVISGVWLQPSGRIWAYGGYSSPAAANFTQVVPLNQWVRLELRYTLDALGSGTVEMWQYFNPHFAVESEYVSSAALTFPGGKPKNAEFHLHRDTGGYWYLDSVAVSNVKLGSAFPEITAPIAGVSHTNTALPVTGRKVYQLGQVVETGTAAGLRAVKTRALGVATEVSLSPPLTGRKTRLLGHATESSISALLRPAHAHRLGHATEADSAHEVTGSAGAAISRVTEVSAALPVIARKVYQLGQAIETTAPAALRPARSALLGQATEVSAAYALTGRKTHLLGQAIEADTATRITRLTAPLQVSPPFVLWEASAPFVLWEASSPGTGWSADPPTT